ncbi:MAG TPA: sugar ABC transporter ATP-binding protein [Thermomicrobiales bacterium]|nr:sugar ABC transporter ATP-binding protein [Thermomicrobiales bacterium]
MSKSFGPTRALEDVSFTAATGERLAILGENGAGKSTLIKIIAGVYRPDRGTILVDGEPYEPASPAEALDRGISVVYQEPSFFPRLSVLDNVYAGRELRDRLGQVDTRRMRREGAILFDELQLPSALLGRQMGSLSLAEQQLVLIARALHVNSAILILDEPTSILTGSESERLFEAVDRLSLRGVTVLYITHRFDELERVADRFLVLKDGMLVGDLTSSTDRGELLRLMSGRQIIADVHRGDTQVAPGAPALEAKGIVVPGLLADVNLTFRRGEVVGLYGLIGSGRTEAMMTIYGGIHPKAGRFELDGESYAPRSPRDAIRHGIAYLPEDRKLLGLFPTMSVQTNIGAAVLGRFTGFLGYLRTRALRAMAEGWRESLSIKTSSLDADVMSLSGGHQQKTLFARILAVNPKVVILDEPTRGIDVATKAVIQQRIVELAGEDLAVCVISSELPELLAIADRIYVLRGGRVVAELTDADLSEEKVLAFALGVHE